MTALLSVTAGSPSVNDPIPWLDIHSVMKGVLIPGKNLVLPGSNPFGVKVDDVSFTIPIIDTIIARLGAGTTIGLIGLSLTDLTQHYILNNDVTFFKVQDSMVSLSRDTSLCRCALGDDALSVLCAQLIQNCRQNHQPIILQMSYVLNFLKTPGLDAAAFLEYVSF